MTRLSLRNGIRPGMGGRVFMHHAPADPSHTQADGVAHDHRKKSASNHRSGRISTVHSCDNGNRERTERKDCADDRSRN